MHPDAKAAKITLKCGISDYEIFCEGRMRIIALLAFLCTFSEVAFAQTSECQSIPKARDRLACYDKAAPPIAMGTPAASKTSTALDKPTAPTTPADQGQVVDMLAAENSKLDAKLKTICRGC